MSMRARFWLSGICLVLGGLTASASHLFHSPLPADPGRLALYVRLSEPVHLALFAGEILVLLGWFGQYALQCSASGITGLVSFVMLFLGIILEDLAHCILEFSVFPVLASLAPYALPSIAEATYHSTPLTVLLNIGQGLILVATPTAAFSIYRCHVLPAWSAIPLGFTTAVLIARLVPQHVHAVCFYSYAALYLSLALLGAAVILSAGKPYRKDASSTIA
jgi:hypothetical protein